MAVNEIHAAVIEWAPEWKKCRDVVRGQKAVKQGGPAYLPKLTGQDEDQYAAYKERATFYNASARTVDGLSGMAFRKDPVVKIPTAAEALTKDVDLAGVGVVRFADLCVEELIVVGFGGVLVDHPTAPEKPVSQADVQRAGLRPYMVFYCAETIYNWQFGRINNVFQLTRVVLREDVQGADPADEFKTTTTEQYRVLDLTDPSVGYRQRIFRKNTEGQFVQFGDEVFPKINGKPIPRIPFYILNLSEAADGPSKPPIMDLVDVNLAHYRNTADLEHGVHYVGLPTPVVTGHRLDQGESLAIGAGGAWVFPSPEAKAYYLEFQGAGLSQLREVIKDKQEQMAALGARMLSPEKKAAETAETASIHRSGESAVLTSICDRVSEVLSAALLFASEWFGVSGEVSVELNTDFIPANIDPALLREVFAMLQAGRISYATFWAILQRGELVDSQKTPDEERNDIEDDGPSPFVESDPAAAKDGATEIDPAGDIGDGGTE